MSGKAELYTFVNMSRKVSYALLVSLSVHRTETGVKSNCDRSILNWSIDCSFMILVVYVVGLSCFVGVIRYQAIMGTWSETSVTLIDEFTILGHIFVNMLSISVAAVSVIRAVLQVESDEMKCSQESCLSERDHCVLTNQY